MSKITEQVKTVIAKQLGVDPGSVTIDAAITDDLGADSLDKLELTMALEDTFNREISDKEAEKLVTVGDIIAHIEGH